jgi:putative hemolysin
MFLCLGLNAVLAAFEIAFVTLPRARLKDLAKNGNRAAQILVELRKSPERTLSVIQVGITLVGALAAAVGGAQAQEWFAPWLSQNAGVSLKTAQGLSVLCIVLPWTILTVVFGELVPKTLALRNPQRIGLAAAKWLSLLDRTFLPIVNFLEWTTKKILKILFPRSKAAEEINSADTVELGSLSHQTRQYVSNLVALEKKRVSHVYLPWTQVDYLLKENALEDVETVVVRSGHTRIPVVDDGQVIGVINTKELLTLIKAGEKDWTTIIRPISRVNEQSSLLMSLRQMQEKRSHLSAVYHGDKLKGIVTMEDILEEVIGEVYDEDDDGALKRILNRRKFSVNQNVR